MNLSAICGSLTPFRVWNPDERDFGVCFTQLALTIPTHFLLAAVSAFYVGALAGPKLEASRRDPSRSLLIRLFCCLILFFLAFVLFFIPYAFSSSPSFLLSSLSFPSEKPNLTEKAFLLFPSTVSSSSPSSSSYRDSRVIDSLNFGFSKKDLSNVRNNSHFINTSDSASTSPSPLRPPLFSPSPADVGVVFVVSGSWLLHCLALWRRRVRANVARTKTRADVIMGLTYLTILFPQAVLARRAILRLASHSANDEPLRWDDADAAVFIVHLVICLAHVVYASALIGVFLIKCIQRMQHTDDLTDLNPLINSDLSVRIVTPSISPSRQYEDGAHCISKLFFCWVNPLLQAGSRGRLDNVSSLYALPQSISIERLSSDIKVYLKADDVSGPSYLDTYDSGTAAASPPPHVERTLPTPDRSSQKGVTLGRALLRMFGNVYFSCGLLKFASDCLAFFGPLLLHALIVFTSSSSSSTNVPSSRGWLIAAALVSSAATCAIIGTQFGFIVGKIQLRMRVTLVQLIYERALGWTTSSLANSQLSAGEIVNAMSTDVDRVVNFCNSFHACWSMPFQIAVSLFLLHREIQLAFLAGLAFAVLLIPINKCLCSQIMHYSSSMMTAKDNRIKLMTELLQGIKSLKFSALEGFFGRKIALHREEELKNLRGVKYLDAMCVFFWATTPVMITLLSFLAFCFMYSSSTLTAAKIFTSLALFNMLIGPLNAMPWVINGLVDAWVSLKRLEKLMEIRVENLKNEGPSKSAPSAISRPTRKVSVSSMPPVIEMESASFTWTEKEDEFKLKDISLSISPGRIVGVVGPVGSGKSALLLSMIGDLHQISGSVHRRWNLENETNLGVGYVGQEAWLLKGSVRENILFGLPFVINWYDSVLNACCLVEDVKAMPEGDGTQVGEKGFSLSGGQKQRIALARAIYAKKRVYILDCPFSALDQNVRSAIWRRGILGLLMRRDSQHQAPSQGESSTPVTVIIASHYGEELFFSRDSSPSSSSSSSSSSSTAAVDVIDWIVKVEEGRLVDQGSPREVLSKTYADRLMEFEDLSSTHPSDGNPVAVGSPAVGTDSSSNAMESEEAKEIGAVATSVYLSYVFAAGRSLSALIILSLILMQASRNVSDWWLSYWVEHLSTEPDANVTSVDGESLYWTKNWRLGLMLSSGGFLSFPAESQLTSPDISFSLMSSNSSSSSYSNSPSLLSASKSSISSFPTFGVPCLLTVYAIIAAFNFVVTLARSFLFALGGVEAAKVLHQKLLQKFLKAPLSFFSSTPAGRVLNRFSSDLYTVDSSLPFILNIFLAQVFGVVGVIIVVCVSLPLFIFLLLPLALFYHRVQFYYRHTSREVKRLSSVTLSPIYAHFTASLEGAPVIRAMAESARFLRLNIDHVGANARAQYAQLIVSQWLNFNLQAMGVVVILGASLAAIVERHYFGADSSFATPALVGLAISYVLSVQDRLSGVVSSFTETEKEMISVERVVDYLCNIPEEEAVMEDTDLKIDGRDRKDSVVSGRRYRRRRGSNTSVSPSLHSHSSLRNASDFRTSWSWPSLCGVVFENVTLVYANSVGNGMDLGDRSNGETESLRMMKALDDVSLSITGGEKILVVGRTGSGKSSLLTALLRLHPLVGGRILIDGIDIRDLPVETLRSNVAVIPQDPLLFSGSIRENLLPISNNDGGRGVDNGSDENEVRSVLSSCRLLGLVNSLGGLDSQIQPTTFSLGQKQLFAAARAILRRCRILCIDEATAHLDSDTEEALHGAINVHASETTLICISHSKNVQLNTDRVLTMSAGRVDSFD